MNNFCVFFFLFVFVRCTPLHRLSCLLVNLTCLYVPFESRLLWQRVRVLSHCPSAIRSWHTKPTQQTRWIPKFSFRNTKIWTLKSCRSHLAYNSLLPFADSDWATNSECIHCKLNVFIQSLNLMCFFFFCRPRLFYYPLFVSYCAQLTWVFPRLWLQILMNCDSILWSACCKIELHRQRIGQTESSILDIWLIACDL